MNNDWFMDYASHRVRLIALEQEWLEIRYWHLFDEQERRGWITKNGRHILIGEDSGSSGSKSGKSVDKSGESGIIKEKSDKPITEIVDSAIERVPLVRISGYSDEQCATIQQQHRELLKFARDNNDSNEVAFVFNSSLQEKKEFKGSDDTIDFGGALYGSDLFIMHNHPRNSSYSLNDITEFLGNQSIKTLTIVKNNGKVETLTKLSVIDRKSSFRELERIIKKKVKTGSKAEYDKVVKEYLTKKVSEGVFEWLN